MLFTIIIAFKIVYKLCALVITADRQGGLNMARYVDLAMAEKLDPTYVLLASDLGG